MRSAVVVVETAGRKMDGKGGKRREGVEGAEGGGGFIMRLYVCVG